MKQVWMRRLFRVSLLFIAVPVYFFYQQLQPSEEVGEDSILLKQTVGPWPVVLIEQFSETPSAGPNGTWFKDYTLMCERCGHSLKAVFLSSNQPIQEEFGVIFSGGPTIFQGRLQVPAEPQREATLWLTLEEWNGHIHQVNVR